MSNQSLIIGVLFVLVFGVGFLIGRVTGTDNMIMGSPISTSSNQEERSNNENESGSQMTAEGEVANESEVSASNMTEGQRKLISAMGLDPDKITITEEMVICAETKLGVARVEEIKTGATPSFSEGVTLVACYN